MLELIPELLYSKDNMLEPSPELLYSKDTVTAEPVHTQLLYHLQGPPVLAVLYSIRQLHGKPGQYQSAEVLLSSHCLVHCDHLTYINGEEYIH